ncbi:hypothetical protein GB931_09465 [Modestobacter sp. I12A-02628]|uniref:Uncharacterized protein n=1 Tax=Goekera deserti TaxID=2497753 RepID=A0A7K3WMC1_9ACTN|nr:hypothetical protein [Goekera deserti]MPQ98145.1 hypothetical protein [Goekera deserti]NDI48794.1 hypothetical protein [Goekera deserti]NEL56683.1 hypothetical protein [Goekera deserti]
MRPSDPFLAAKGIAIPWRMATIGGSENYEEDPTLTPRALLFHGPHGHLGAVDPAQARQEQSDQWKELAVDSLSCSLCPTVDWDSLETPLIATGYTGFFDLVPGARDLDDN